MTRLLCDGGDPTRMAHARAMACGRPAAIAVEGGTSHVHPARLGHRLQSVQALGKQPHLWCMHGCTWEGAKTAPWLSGMALPCSPCGCLSPAEPIPSPWRILRARGCAWARWAPRATHACQSDPSAAHGAQTLATVGAWLAGVPWASGGIGTHGHGIPVQSTPTMRWQTRCEPRGPCSPRVGLARCGQRHAGHALSASGTGVGVGTSFAAVVLLMQGPHVPSGDGGWASRVLQTPQQVRPIYKTRNQL